MVIEGNLAEMARLSKRQHNVVAIKFEKEMLVVMKDVHCDKRL